MATAHLAKIAPPAIPPVAGQRTARSAARFGCLAGSAEVDKEACDGLSAEHWLLMLRSVPRARYD